MSFEIAGKLFKKFDTVSKTESFQAREFVIEHNPSQYPQFIKFQLTQDRCGLIESYQEGEELIVHFDIRGNKWTDPKSNEDKYFTNLNAWKVDKPVAATPQDGQPMNAQQEPPAATDALPKMDEEDLPF